MIRISISLMLLVLSLAAFAQSEMEDINKVLYDYIESTANGEPDRLRTAFHEDLNLYFVRNDTMVTWQGQGYINNIKPGVKSNRVGKVVSIDYTDDAAIAKIEILMPERKRLFTDYLMLLKIENKWTIIHKSFTSKSTE